MYPRRIVSPSPAYVRGIYAPKVEMAAYHFHRLLAADLAP
jgi:hypothetical protein